jgi:hypothetical protein
MLPNYLSMILVINAPTTGLQAAHGQQNELDPICVE